MAVLVEGISVVVKRSALTERYPGGWNGLVENCPNKTFCADSDLTRIGFMAPKDVGTFVQDLEVAGLIFQEDGAAVDLAVVDQMRGPTTRCDWLEFGHVEIDGNGIAACRLVGSQDNALITPDGWRYEGSLTESYGFTPTDAEAKGLRFLRHEGSIDVYFGWLTGKEVYVGRAGIGSRAPSGRTGKDKE